MCVYIWPYIYILTVYNSKNIKTNLTIHRRYPRRRLVSETKLKPHFRVLLILARTSSGTHRNFFGLLWPDLSMREMEYYVQNGLKSSSVFIAENHYIHDTHISIPFIIYVSHRMSSIAKPWFIHRLMHLVFFNLCVSHRLFFICAYRVD